MILRARGIHKRLGGRAVLAGAEVELRAGEAVVLEGANGAGKTTLLKILAGLLRPDSCAEFSTADDEAENGAAAGKRLGGWRRWNGAVYAHQAPHMFMTTALGNVEYGLLRRGVGRAEARRRALAALEWAGMPGLAAAPAWKLSGGEVRRVALARAMVLRPRLYLLDEPAAHLDADGARRMRELLERLRAEGAAMLVAAHDARPPCDRRLLLRGGTIRERD